MNQHDIPQPVWITTNAELANSCQQWLNEPFLALDTEFIRTNTFFFFKQKTAYEIGLGIPAEPLFRSSSHIGATAKDISNVVTDAASGVVDIFHGIDKAVADTWNNFWKDGKADGIGSNLSRKTVKLMVLALICLGKIGRASCRERV